MAVRFRKGIDWEHYGVDVLKYEFLSKGLHQKDKDSFINTDELKKELQQEGVDTDAIRKRFMGIE